VSCRASILDIFVRQTPDSRRYGPDDPTLLVVLGLKDLAAAIETVRTHMMTSMHFTGRRLVGKRGRRYEIVRAVHAAP